MKLSNTYFKKLDDLAKWIFKGGNKDVTRARTIQPDASKEGKLGYLSFRNDSNLEHSADLKGVEVCQNKTIKTEREQNSFRESGRYIKKTARGKENTLQGCTICLDAPANAVLMDCGHGAICFDCGIALLNTTCECHLCRRPVIQVLKIDTSFVNEDLLKVVEAADLYNLVKYNTHGMALHTSNI